MFITIPRGHNFSHIFVISFVISVCVDPRFGGFSVTARKTKGDMAENGGKRTRCVWVDIMGRGGTEGG